MTTSPPEDGSPRASELVRWPRDRRRQARRGSPGLDAGDLARSLPRRRDRRAEGCAHPPRRRGDRHGRGDRLHRRSRRRSEGRAHVAFPGAVRGSDRGRRRRGRGHARRGPRRADREPRRRAAGRPQGRGLDPRSVARPPSDPGHRAQDAGDGDSLRDRRGFGVRHETRRRRRGERDQRVPVRAGARPQPRERAAARSRIRLRRRREDRRARPDRNPQPARPRDALRRDRATISTPRCSSASSSAR